MNTTNDPPPTAEIAQRLSVAITRLRSRLREEAGMHATGLSISQLAVLLRVLDEGPVTAASLATAEHVSSQSIAQNLAILKAAGFVQARQDPNDGRKTLITITEAGSQLLTSLQASRQSFLVQAIDALVAPEDLADLDRTIDLLERLAAAEVNDKEGNR